MSTEIRSSRFAAGSGARRGGCRRRWVPPLWPPVRRRSAARSARWLRAGCSFAAGFVGFSAARLARLLLRRPAASGRGRHGCHAAACFSAPRRPHRLRSLLRSCCVVLLRGLRLSRGGRSLCDCALGRVLLLLVLPSKPGQVVPLLVVARAGTRLPTGKPASRCGCRKPWPYSVGPRDAGYQCGGRRGLNWPGRPCRLGGGRAKARPAGANGAQALIEARPGPRLDLGVARLGLDARRFEVLEPGIRLFDLQQLLCELYLRHRHSLRLVGVDAILGPGPDGPPRGGRTAQMRRRAAPSAWVPA